MYPFNEKLKDLLYYSSRQIAMAALESLGILREDVQPGSTFMDKAMKVTKISEDLYRVDMFSISVGFVTEVAMRQDPDGEGEKLSGVIRVANPADLMKRTHWLKCTNPAFMDVVSQQKKAEYRYNDRGYMEGDVLILMEYEPIAGHLTGGFAIRQITNMVSGYGIPEGYAMMSITPIHHVSMTPSSGTYSKVVQKRESGIPTEWTDILSRMYGHLTVMDREGNRIPEVAVLRPAQFSVDRIAMRAMATYIGNEELSKHLNTYLDSFRPPTRRPEDEECEVFWEVWREGIPAPDIMDMHSFMAYVQAMAETAGNSYKYVRIRPGLARPDDIVS